MVQCCKASGAAIASLSPAITSPEMILLCSLMSAQSVVAAFEAKTTDLKRAEEAALSPGAEECCDR